MTTMIIDAFLVFLVIYEQGKMKRMYVYVCVCVRFDLMRKYRCIDQIVSLT